MIAEEVPHEPSFFERVGIDVDFEDEFCEDHVVYLIEDCGERFWVLAKRDSAGEALTELLRLFRDDMEMPEMETSLYEDRGITVRVPSVKEIMEAGYQSDPYGDSDQPQPSTIYEEAVWTVKQGASVPRVLASSAWVY